MKKPLKEDFTRLYREYAADVFRFALYLSGNTAWAEDLTAETFVRAWTRIDALQMPTVKAYLLAIVRNLYHSQVRREQRYARLGDHIPDRALGPEASAELRSQLREVLRVVQTLDEIDRAALLLRALYDMPYREIAVVLGISPSAARVKVHRARLKLTGFNDSGGNHDRSDT
jgi:RNA polymerase sigma factor (sigma-70 family)